MALPGKILNLTLTQVRLGNGDPAVRLKFDHDPNATSYVATRQAGLPVEIEIPAPDDHHGSAAFVLFDDPVGVGDYTYSVAGVSTEGTGEYSDTATISVVAPALVATLTAVEVVRADGKVGVEFAFDYQDGVTGYRFVRQDPSGPVTYTFSQPALPPSNRRLLYQDFYVVSPGDYTYSVYAVNGTLAGDPTDVTVSLTTADGGVPGTGSTSYTAGLSNPGVVRWTFRDVWGTGGTEQVYTFEINPNEGGSPTIQKNIAVATNVGPNRGAILQEGQNTAPVLNFSGVLITQTHYEALETWFDKKILLELKDDLGRTFRGVFSSFEPTRVRKPYNPWYHSYTAQFTVFGYKNASGQIRYGRF